MSPASANPRGQTRRGSIIEAILNVIIGFWISVLANIYLLPLWGFLPSLSQGIEIGIAFTWVSLLRSYVLRRAFNYLHIRQNRS